MKNTEMENALNQQINAELWSAYLYLSMSCDMDNNGRVESSSAGLYSLDKQLGKRGNSDD